MAGDTESHLEVFSLYPVHGFYFTMTSFAFNILLDVSLVIEKNMLGKIVGLNPGSRRTRIEVLVLFLYPGMIGDNVFMTIEAFLYRRNAGIFGTGYIWVTELAMDLLHTRVYTVTERYGLFRAHVRARRHVEQVKK